MVASMLGWLGGGEAGTGLPGAQGSSAAGEGAWASGGGSAFDGQRVDVPLHPMDAPVTLPRPHQISLGSHATRPTTSAPPVYGASTSAPLPPPPSAQCTAAPYMLPPVPPTNTLQLGTGAGDRALPSTAAFQGSPSVPHRATVPVNGLPTMGTTTATLPNGPPPSYTNMAQAPPSSSASLFATSIPMASAPPSSTEPAPRSSAPPPPLTYAPPTAGGSGQLTMGGGTTRTGSGARSPPRRAATMGDRPATTSAGQVSTAGARIQPLFDTLTAVLTYHCMRPIDRPSPALRL
jgi:hypothetical protein